MNSRNSSPHTYVIARAFRHTLRAILCVVVPLALFSCGRSGGVRPTVKSQTEVLYVGSSNGQILAFGLDVSSGALTDRGAILGPQISSDFKIDPSGKFLFASDLSAGLVYAYTIDSASGNLTAVGGSPFAASPAASGIGLAIDPTGKFLFHLGVQGMSAPLSSQGMIAAFTIDGETGALARSSQPALPDDNGPNQIVVEPSGRFLYVANSNNQCGRDFAGYSIDSETGLLTQVAGSPFTFEPNSRPYAMAVFSAGSSLLFSSLTNKGVGVMSVDDVTGALEPVPSSPFTAGFAPQSLALHPSGRFLYVRNSGNDSVSEFTVNSNTGFLTTISGSPFTDGNDGKIAADPSGLYLFELGIATPQVAILRVDQSTGVLTTGVNLPLPSISETNAIAVLALP